MTKGEFYFQYFMILVRLIVNKIVFGNDSNSKNSLEGLAKLTVSRFWQFIVKWLNNWMIFSTGIANVIFAVKFMKFAFVNMGYIELSQNDLAIHLIAFLLSIPFSLVSKIGIFVATSLISTFFIITCVFSVSTYSAIKFMEDGKSNSTHMARLQYFGEFFGVVCFSIEGIGLMLPIRSSLKNRDNFRKLFNGVCIAIISIYFISGSAGALAYGDHASSIILFNFGKNYPFIYPQSLLYAIGIFVSFPYVIFPLAPSLKKSSVGKKLFGVRTTLH